MACSYIYLLKPFFSVTSNQDVYKIGKTCRVNYKRFNEYPEGSILLLQSSCKNCDTMEKNLLKIFDEKFIRRTEYGREYFEGDITLMRDIVNEEIRNEEVDCYVEGRVEQNNVESKAETSESEKGFSAVPNHQNKYKCSECDKSYKHRQSLFTHKKTCSIESKNGKSNTHISNTEKNESQPTHTNELLLKLIQQNSEMINIFCSKNISL